MINISLGDLLADFRSREIDTDELEELIINAINEEYPKVDIEEIQYTDDGVNVIVKDGDNIGIDIDWEEIIIT